MIPAPIFVLAPPRSYTSLFSASLGQHPELYGLPELNLFQASTGEDFWSGKELNGSVRSPFWATMRHGLLRTIAQLYAGEQTIDSIQMAERWIKQRQDAPVGQIYRELAERVAPLRLVEKSPGYLRHREYLDRLLAAFPEACFIHLIRHPLGQCQSTLKTRGGPQALFLLSSIDYSQAQPILDPQILWHDAHIQIQRFLSSVPFERQCRVIGEDFLANPDEVLGKVCHWLEISAAPEAIAAMKHPEASPYSCEGPANARLGNDINFLRSPRLEPGRPMKLSLDEPLPWRPDGAAFHPRVRALAGVFGYKSSEGCLPPVTDDFLGPQLWNGPGRGEEPTLNLRLAMQDKALKALGEKLLAEFKNESESAAPEQGFDSSDLAELRNQQARLVLRADMLEAMLEETLNELAGVESVLQRGARDNG